MEAVNTALSSQGLLHPNHGQLQVPVLNPLCLCALRLKAGMRNICTSPPDPPALVLLGLSTHPSKHSTHRGTPRRRARTMPG